MTLIDVGKNWEGRVIDGKFPLRQWLVVREQCGISHRTDRRRTTKSGIKLIRAEVFSAGISMKQLNCRVGLTAQSCLIPT